MMKSYKKKLEIYL